MAPDFAGEPRRLRAERGLSLRELAALAHHGKSYLHDLETDRKPPTADVARRLDDALRSGGRLAAALRQSADDADADAIELVRRVTASDVSPATSNGWNAPPTAWRLRTPPR